MEFRPATTTDGRSAIDLWDGASHVATVYAQREGLHIVCDPPYVPEDLALEVQLPAGVVFAIRRQD